MTDESGVYSLPPLVPVGPGTSVIWSEGAINIGPFPANAALGQFAGGSEG